jgi:hypothetical protein
MRGAVVPRRIANSAAVIIDVIAHLLRSTRIHADSCLPRGSEDNNVH